MRRRCHQPQCLRFLGRLSTLTGLVAALAGCEDKEAPVAPKSRAAAIAATTPATSASVASAAPSEAPAEPHRELCAGQLEGKGRDLPAKAALSQAGRELPEAPEFSGRWTWVNFWAAWCVPCREEIPRLSSWEQKLSPKMSLVFISLDDDERQLQAFIEKQPSMGIKSTYWLRDGKEREEWLAGASLDTDPELPMHLLVDPTGKIRCVVRGAVEDADYERVQEIVSG